MPSHSISWGGSNSRLSMMVLLISMLHPYTVIASERSLSFSIRLFDQAYSALFDNDNGDYKGEEGHYKDGAWNGDNEISGTRFQSDGGQQAAFSGTYQYGDFYTGLNIQLGESYRFKENAPDQVTQEGITEVANDKIGRKELDIIFGYYLNQYFSLFVDVKRISSTWASNHYRQEFIGPGAGVTGLWPIINSLTLYGSAGFILSGEIKGNGQKVGKGHGAALDIGLMYAINPTHRVMLGLKESHYVYKFDAGHEQTQHMGAAYLGYSYAFSLD